MNTYGEFWVYDKSGVLANEFTVTDNLAGMAVSEVVVTEGIVLGSSDATDAAKRAEKSAEEAKKSEQNAAATLANTYTKSEIDNKVTDVGMGRKKVMVQKPDGITTDFYVPVMLTGLRDHEQVVISTMTSGGSHPMNNCSFNGIIRSGGWSDMMSYTTGQFSIYTMSERSLHSVYGGTESDGVVAFYVHEKAFPVTVTVDASVGVSTGASLSWGSTIFTASADPETGNTKSVLRAEWKDGNGFYLGSSKVHSSPYIDGELNKKFDKVGGTITGLTSIEGRTTLGAYSIKRSGSTQYSTFGQSGDSGGEALIGVGQTQEAVDAYLKVGIDKLEYFSVGGGRYKVFHEGQVPTLGKDLGLQWQLPSPGGTARYVRLVTLGLTDNDTTFILSGFGDHGSAKRATYNVAVATRSSGISVDVNSLDVDLLYGGKPRFYHRRVGDVFEVWVKTPAFNLDATFTRMSGRGGVIRIDSTTTTEPADLTEVTVNQIYTTRFKPTPSDVGTLSESVINAELNKKFDKVGGDITGDVRFNSGNTTRLSLGSGTDYYIERSPSGLFLSSGSINPKVRVNNTNYDIYHTGNKPSADDVNALPITGGTLTGALGITHQGIGLIIRRSTYPNIVLESTDLTDARQKYIEVSSGGGLNIITRRANGTNNGTVTINPGQDGVVYHTGNKPSAADVNALPITGGTLTGNLVVNGEIRSSGAISYYSNNTNLGIILSSNANGYTEIVRNSNAAEWTEGLRSYGGADWRIGSNRIYTQGFKPSPGDLGAVSKSGDNITGQMQYTGSFNGTSTNAQIAHLGNDASQSLFIRNMREHYTSAWIWEKVYSGSLYYAMGVNGNSTSKIRLSPGTTGEIYLGNADKRVYHEGFKPTAADVGTYTQAQVDAMIAKLKTDNGLK